MFLKGKKNEIWFVKIRFVFESKEKKKTFERGFTSMRQTYYACTTYS